MGNCTSTAADRPPAAENHRLKRYTSQKFTATPGGFKNSMRKPARRLTAEQQECERCVEALRDGLLKVIGHVELCDDVPAALVPSEPIRHPFAAPSTASAQLFGPDVEALAEDVCFNPQDEDEEDMMSISGWTVSDIEQPTQLNTDERLYRLDGLGTLYDSLDVHYDSPLTEDEDAFASSLGPITPGTVDSTSFVLPPSTHHVPARACRRPVLDTGYPQSSYNPNV